MPSSTSAFSFGNIVIETADETIYLICLYSSPGPLGRNEVGIVMRSGDHWEVLRGDNCVKFDTLLFATIWILQNKMFEVLADDLTEKERSIST